MIITLEKKVGINVNFFEAPKCYDEIKAMIVSYRNRYTNDKNKGVTNNTKSVWVSLEELKKLIVQNDEYLGKEGSVNGLRIYFGIENLGEGDNITAIMVTTEEDADAPENDEHGKPTTLSERSKDVLNALAVCPSVGYAGAGIDDMALCPKCCNITSSLTHV